MGRKRRLNFVTLIFYFKFFILNLLNEVFVDDWVGGFNSGVLRTEPAVGLRGDSGPVNN